MRIGGFQPFSLSDFPGKVAAIVFTQGCNFRCPYCHNRQLIPENPPDGRLISGAAVLRFLECRRGQLDGVVVTGGEPTIQEDLRSFLSQLKALGYTVKLDTNGSRPDVLRCVFEEGLVDFVAMDFKAQLLEYTRTAGVMVDVETIADSMRVIAASGIMHEFRTTLAPGLAIERQGAEILQAVLRGSPHRFQPCR